MVKGHVLHSKIYGEDQTGTPLLVFHGLFGMLDNWGSFGKIFGAERPTHLLDLRNHGKSFHADTMRHQDLVQDILQYLEKYTLDRVILLGHSLGGKAVMQFALAYPERVEKLIVVDIAPKAYPPHHQGIIKALESVDFTAVGSRQEVENILAQYIPERSVIQFLTKNLYWTEEKQLAWRFNLPVLASQYAEYVSRAIDAGIYNGPTLFIAGEKSNYILPQDEFSIKQQFPDFQLVKIARAGHWVQAENPKDFNNAVHTFLAS